MNNPYSLDGRTILITGAASGIGKCTAVECSKMGASVILVDLNSEGLNATMNLLVKCDVNEMFAGNLTDEKFLMELAEQTPELDGVFLCAGVSDTTPVKFFTKEKIDRVFGVNVVSPAMMLRYLLSKKKIRKCGSLVWMSSYGAEQVESGLGIYAASKSAVNGLMRTYAKE